MEIFTLSFEILKNSLYDILIEDEIINNYLSIFISPDKIYIYK